METSVSLLDALRVGTDQQAWSKMVELYAPFIRQWLRVKGAAAHDIDDIVQDVLSVVLRRLPEFEKQPHSGAFRGWLRTITVNTIRNHWRTQNKHPTATGGSDFLSMINELEDPHSQISKLWDLEHNTHVTRYLLDKVESQFQPKTWQAFLQFAIEGNPATQVADRLGISENAVFIAKSRVMAELRKQGAGLID